MTKIFLKITKFYEQNKNFDICVTSETYNLLTFDFNKNTNEPLSYDVNQILLKKYKNKILQTHLIFIHLI